ncbi:ribonuclease HII [bacterium]|nr:ribonuclease HII [bacterium]
MRGAELRVSFAGLERECGLDEAGRGCLAGPVTVGAVVLRADRSILGLNDSKQLRADQRERLEAEIKEKTWAWAVVHLEAAHIDRVNILQAVFDGMHTAVESLRPVPELLLVDGNRFRPFLGIAHRCIVQGDGLYQSIAAASILAKTARDRWMLEAHERFPYYQWDSNKGYPSPAHRRALIQHGPSPLHRRTFKGV